MRSATLRWLLGSQVLAMGADVVLTLALGIWIQQLTGSASKAGGVYLFFALPSLVAPLAGPLIDRFPRRTVLIATNVILSFTVLLLLLVKSSRDLELIYLTAFIYGMGAQVTFAARAAVLPSVVEPDNLEQTNGLFESLRQGIRVVGPLVGTAILVTWGSVALALGVSFTLLLSAALMLPIVSDRSHLTSPSEYADKGLFRSAWTSFRVGMSSSWTIAPVRQLIGVYAITFAAAGVLEVVIFSYVAVGLGRPASFVATLTTLQGLGSIIGGFAVGRLSNSLGVARTQMWALILLTTAVAFLTVSTAIFVAMAAFVLLGAGLVAFLVSYVTLVQRETPADRRGTVFLAVESFGNLPFVICIGASSLLLSITSYRYLLMAATVALVIATSLVVRTAIRGSSTASFDQGVDGQSESSELGMRLHTEAVSIRHDAPS